MLQNERILLREIASTDTPNIIRWRNNPNVRERFMQQELFTEESHEEWLRTQVQTGHVAQYIITDRVSGRDVGSTFLRDIDNDNHHAEIGIFIGENEARGCGLGVSAVLLLTEHGFQELKLHRVFARILADNDASLRCFEKAGYIRESYCHDDVRINDRYRDIVFMAKISPYPTPKDE